MWEKVVFITQPNICVERKQKTTQNSIRMKVSQPEDKEAGVIITKNNLRFYYLIQIKKW